MNRSRFRSSIIEAALLSAIPSVAMEEEKVDGKVSKEIEHMFYARVVSSADLLKATSVEIQEQWGLWHDKTDKNAGSGSVRIRKTVVRDIVDGVIVVNPDTVAKYVMTTKIKTASGDALEIPIETTEDNFKAFKILAETGMVKHRYRFPVEGTDLTWEVDMFPLHGEDVTVCGKYFDHAKIDLEVKSKHDELPAFPAGFTEVFDPKTIQAPTAEQLQVKKRMDEYLNTPNVHVKAVYQGM